MTDPSPLGHAAELAKAYAEKRDLYMKINDLNPQSPLNKEAFADLEDALDAFFEELGIILRTEPSLISKAFAQYKVVS